MSRKIDALVAEHVMGLTEGDESSREVLHMYDKDNNPVYVPHYSTDIAAAWEVMEKIHPLEVNKYNEYEKRLVIGRNPYISPKAVKVEWCVMYMGYDCLEIFERADTAPMAICLAALKVKGVEVGD